ncbi:MAG: SGNH/GDSL hydrolase family protein [Pseudomonadota bacterium]|nr:SGNH/GDSL hydrolase family protein [Pseudomonadota bacterium]
MAVLLAAIFTYIFSNKYHVLYISMKSSVSATAKIYYDRGNGLNETDSLHQSIKKGFSILEFQLPDFPIHYIRFDPLDKTGYFSISEIKIIDNKNNIIQEIDLSAIQALNQIAQIKFENNVLRVETVKDANDPMLSLPFSYPLIIDTTIYFSSILSKFISIAIILSIIFFFVFRLGYYLNNQYNILPKTALYTNPKFHFSKNSIINLSILFFSTSISVLFAYYLYTYLNKSPESEILPDEETSDYALSFYNSEGQKITERNGRLKLVTDPFTIYRHYPNQSSNSYSIDRYGFREGYINEHSNQLAIVLGGSAAFGQGLTDDHQTFASEISRINPKYNLLNAAMVGFLSGQELSQMVHYLSDFKPSLYILFDGWNDIFVPFTYVKDWPVSHAPIGFNNNFFMIEQRLYHYYLVNKRDEKDKDKSIATLPPLGEPLDEAEYFHKIKERYIANILKMSKFSKSNGANFLLVFQPELGNKKIISSAERNTLKTWNQSLHYLDKKIPEKYKQFITDVKQTLQEHNILFIDINEISEFNENPKTLFYDPVHPNSLGHKIIAKIINSVLLEHF